MTNNNSITSTKKEHFPNRPTTPRQFPDLCPGPGDDRHLDLLLFPDGWNLPFTPEFFQPVPADDDHRYSVGGHGVGDRSRAYRPLGGKIGWIRIRFGGLSSGVYLEPVLPEHQPLLTTILSVLVGLGSVRCTALFRDTSLPICVYHPSSSPWAACGS